MPLNPQEDSGRVGHIWPQSLCRRMLAAHGLKRIQQLSSRFFSVACTNYNIVSSQQRFDTTMAAAQSSTEASATECKVALCQMKVVAVRLSCVACEGGHTEISLGCCCRDRHVILLRLATAMPPDPFKPFIVSRMQDKAANIAKAKELVVKAAADGAKIIVLPEVFNGCDSKRPACDDKLVWA